MPLNEKGQITWPALLLTFLFATAALTTLFEAKKTAISLKQMTDHALCLKRSLHMSQSYTSRMGKLNRTIRLQHYARLTAIAAGQMAAARVAKITKQLTQKGQILYHISFVKNIMTLSPCSLFQRLQIRQLIPYRSVLNLKRARLSDGTLALKKKWRKEWDFKLRGKNYTSKARLSMSSRFTALNYRGKQFKKSYFAQVRNFVDSDLRDLSSWKHWLGY